MRHSHSYRARRADQLTRAIAASSLLLGCGAAIARADSGFTLDLRVHGTGAKDATVYGPGDVLTLDLYVTATGTDADPNNDAVDDVMTKFFSSTGDLHGDLIGLTPPNGFNVIGSTIGLQRDLDGDGDLDIGSNDWGDYNAFYFSHANVFAPPSAASGIRVASVQFTATQLSAATTQIGVALNTDNFSLVGLLDGLAVNLGAGSPMLHMGAPVTIHANEVFDPGTPVLLSGTQSTHLNVAGTIRQGGGSPLVVDGGISIAPGGLFDMRDSSGHYGAQEVRVNDTTSGNSGGAGFMNNLTIGQSSAGAFVQSGGYTAVNSTLAIGAGADGSLSMTGGSLRATTVNLATGANATITHGGGNFFASNFNMAPASGVSGLIDISQPGFTLGNGTIGGGAGDAIIRVRDAGVLTINGSLTLHSDSAGHSGSLQIQSGTVQGHFLNIQDSAAMEQSDGTMQASGLNIGIKSSDGAQIAQYTLSGGALNASGMIVGATLSRGMLHQTGGAVSSRNIDVEDYYQLVDGTVQTQFLTVNIPHYNGRDNLGLLEQSGGSLTTDRLILYGTYRITGGTFTINETIEDHGGTIDFQNTPASFNAGANSLVQLPTNAIGNSSNATLHGAAGSMINYPAGYNPVAHFASVSTDGLLHEDGTALNIPHGKSVTGSGAIAGAVTNHGEINPGFGAGELDINGDYTQMPDGVFNLEIGGEDQVTSFDLLNVSGVAQLAGDLKITLTNGFVPDSEMQFQFLTAGSIAGGFANGSSVVSLPGGQFDIHYEGASVYLDNYQATPEPVSLAGLMLAGVMLGRRRTRA